MDLDSKKESKNRYIDNKYEIKYLPKSLALQQLEEYNLYINPPVNSEHTGRYDRNKKL